MTELQKICAARKVFTDTLHDSNIFPMWKKNNYEASIRVKVSLDKNNKRVCVRASDVFLVFGKQNIKQASTYRFKQIVMIPDSEKLKVTRISGIKYSVEYIAEYIVPFTSMSASDMFAAAYSLA